MSKESPEGMGKSCPDPCPPPRRIGKSITEELAAMESGETTSAQITKAYLDRIVAYNDGSKRRPAPSRRRHIYGTTEMPTTGGSLVFENYVPEKNSFIVQQLIDAGAIIIGKANLSEFANSGFYSASAYGQVWNAFDPSKASIGCAPESEALGPPRRPGRQGEEGEGQLTDTPHKE
ncbi:MAG TPA: amidase family protein [Solirubrobacterales bacterium]